MQFNNRTVDELLESLEQLKEKDMTSNEDLLDFWLECMKLCLLTLKKFENFGD